MLLPFPLPAGERLPCLRANASELRRRHRRRAGPEELQATHGGAQVRTGGDARRRRRWARAGGSDIKGARGRSHGRSGGGAAGAWTRRAGVCALPDWLPARAGSGHSPAPTGVGREASDGHGRAGSQAVKTAAGRVGRAAGRCVLE
jgi:hypothetical protein